MTTQESKTAKKLKLPEVVGLMNARGSIRAAQRAGQKKRQGKRGHDQVTAEDEAAESIEVEGPPARRQRIKDPEVGGLSPSVAAAVRGGRTSGRTTLPNSRKVRGFKGASGRGGRRRGQ